MNITALNAVIAAAAKHGFTVEIKPDGQHVKVLKPSNCGELPVCLCSHADPVAAFEAINRAVTPQPEKFFTLDEAIANAASPLPWRVTQKETYTKLADADDGSVTTHDPNEYDCEMGLSESQAILVAHCVTQLPKLLAAIRAWQPGQDATALGQAMVEANRVPGKVVLP